MSRRQRIKGYVVVLIAAIILSAVLRITPVAQGYSANLSVSISQNVLEASRNSTLTMEIVNVGKYLKELDVALTIPPPLVLFGDNHWIRPSFAYGDAIRANLTVFAPSSAAGMTSQGSVVAVYKVIGETTPTTETHVASFLVRGWIDLQAYEITVDPNPALPGSEITISGNLLNRGVISAMYANVSAVPDQPLVAGSIKPTYVGQIDPNAPAPFSLTAIVDPNTAAGSYSLTIQVFYRDDLQADHLVNILIGLSVVSELPSTQTTPPSITEQVLSNQMLLLALGVVIILIIVVVYVRRRRKAQET